MIVCIFERVQWRWVLNDRLARAYTQGTTMATTQSLDVSGQ
jgi:hypothetical protein